MRKIFSAIRKIVQIPFNLLFFISRPFRFFVVKTTLNGIVWVCDRMINEKISGRNDRLELSLRSHQARIEILLSMVEQGLFDNMHDPIEIYIAAQEDVNAIWNVRKLIDTVPVEQL